MHPPVSIVVPVPDVAQLSDCLAAIAAQTVAPDGVVLVQASGIAPVGLWPAGADVAGVNATVLNAGASVNCAVALDRVAAIAPAGAVLLSTHPPAVVAPDWIAATLAHFAAGAEVVAGCLIAADAAAESEPAPVDQYAALLEEIAALLDPVPYDPWPHHADESDLSLAITLDAWQRVASADLWADDTMALMAALRRSDAVIRHAPDVRVAVPPEVRGSVRTMLEGTDAAARRSRLRRLARAAFAGRLRLPQLATALRLPRRSLAAWFEQGFGAAWQEIEAASPVLRRRPVAPGDLSREIERALRLRDGLRAVSPEADATVCSQSD